ncbi:unnamed protein product [Closterium sp. NIES-64]|nr:unnamed protein product [Closterium sp. NIES-64]
MAVATIRTPGLNYRPRNPTLVRYRSSAAQEALSRAQRASSSAWQSLATAAAEPVALPKQLQESVQALPLPPNLKGRLGIADGSAVLLTRGHLAAAVLAVGLLVKGIQSWVKARATALNSESTVPAPLLPASPNLPTIPDLPPIVPTKITAKDAPGVSPIDMDEIDRLAAAAASKGDVSDSEIDDRPRLIKLQQDNAMAWFALITGFLVLVAYSWNPANPLNP